MDIRAAGGEGADRVGGQLAVLGLCDEQLRPVGEEFGRAALVGLDMRRGRADHAMIALAQGGERQRIGRRAVEREEHLALGLEQRAERVRRAVGEGVFAISGDIALIRLGHRCPGLGADSGIVVAGELLGAEWLGHDRVHHKSFCPCRESDEGKWRFVPLLPVRPHPSPCLERHHLAGGQVGAGRRPDS